MPGKKSLQAGEYYAHPRNQFWPIMGELIGARPDLPYRERLAMLSQSGIALWNVIESCRRTGSLDSAIRERTLYDFQEFFASQQGIYPIFFNGKEPCVIFERYIMPKLIPRAFHLTALPSTSPAYAKMSFNKKLTAWRQIQRCL